MSEISPILFVDDEPANLVLFERTLEDAYDIRTALSAREAIETVGRDEVHLVLSDQRMPGMTGVELLARLCEERPEVMRLLTTAYSDVETVIDAINEGHVYQYVPKPWEEEDLKKTLDAALERYERDRRHRELVDELRREAERAEEVRRALQSHVPPEVAAEALAAATDPLPQDGSRPGVLYVDDEIHNLSLFAAAFGDDYEIFTASSGAEALEILRREEVRLVVSDQRMPGMTGVELLSILVEERPDTARIILTGYIDIEAAILAINAGRTDGYVTKPWDMDAFQATIERALETYEERKHEHQRPEELRWRIAREDELRRNFEPHVPPEVVAEILAAAGE